MCLTVRYPLIENNCGCHHIGQIMIWGQWLGTTDWGL
jgi:hypothetical protein